MMIYFKKAYKSLHLVLLAAILVVQSGNAFSENLKSVKSLKGSWKFSIGDDPSWANPQFDDSAWETVFVPDTWEENGFRDYNGFAWYRKSFQLQVPGKQEYLYLDMGFIDDVDEVYFNGKLIGTSGNFPPLVKTAYDVPRMYPLPSELINKDGDNVIAVRVYDEYYNGGIVRGNIGIFVNLDQQYMDVDLTGYWDFEVGCSIDEGFKKCVTYKEGKIFVPGFWESRGYNDCDGQAIYRRIFTFPDDVARDNKALVLGIIDDTDEVLLNGVKIKWIRSKRSRRSSGYSHHMTFRAYPIPANLLERGENRIEVMVNDFMGPGGIYSGPIGITDLERAKMWVEREYKDDRSPLEKLWDSFWD